VIVGVISDTHGLLRPEAFEALRGSDHILHAGDIGSQEILERLGQLAPVQAIRGNVDVENWTHSIPVSLQVDLGGVKFFMIHNRADLKVRSLRTLKVKVVIFGHSHKPLIENSDGVLYFNPGSAGPRRFKLPISVGRIRITEEEMVPELITLTGC
jgi:putative phosphoesterase